MYWVVCLQILLMRKRDAQGVMEAEAGNISLLDSGKPFTFLANQCEKGAWMGGVRPKHAKTSLLILSSF